MSTKSSPFLVLAALIAGGSLAAQTNLPTTSPVPPASILTNFVQGASLAPSEVRQVVSLAHQCGMSEVGEVETFRYLPGPELGIQVKSPKRVTGRNTSRDSLYVNRLGWYDSEPDPKAKRLGPFWVPDPHKTTTLWRAFEIDKKTVQVVIDPGMDLAVADKIMELLAARKLRFEDDARRKEFAGMIVSNPEWLTQPEMGGDRYEIRFNEPRLWELQFKVENDALLVTGIRHINI